MIQQEVHVDKKLHWHILGFAKRIAGSSKITAACICGDYALGLSDQKAALEVLLVICGFQPRFMNYVKSLEGRNGIFYAVDQWVFERDVVGGFLGEALAGKMIFPYIPLENAEYLRTQEVRLKKRLIHELMENLVLDFPELSYEFHIKPEYFMYETMLSRARLFPLVVNSLLNFVNKERKEQNVRSALDGYLKALGELEEKGLVTLSNGYVRISEKFVKNFRRRKIQLINFVKSAQRAQRTLFQSSLGIFPEILTSFSKNREAFFRLRLLEPDSNALRQIENPQNFLYVPTTHGLVSFADRTDIKAIARKVLSVGDDADVAVSRIGGVLNDVYVIEAPEGNKERVVVKRYRDWASFKWFPLTLWAVGTRTFAVLGLSRLEKEVAINQFLGSRRFEVPRILYVSPNQRLVFMEYVEGEDVGNVIRRIASLRRSVKVQKSLTIVNRVGKKLAKVHALGVALGDTKPENIRIGVHGEIFWMDLEQASRDGDKVWDVAEFLYYAGHDLPPLADIQRAELIAESFVSGYLDAGGAAETIKKAATPKYTKVFSVFTFPNVMLAIVNVCRKNR